MPDRAPTKSARCPHCSKRASLREYQGVMDTFERYSVCTWQCIYCGAVCEPNVRGMRVVAFDRIVLRPGELEELRHARELSI